MCVGGGGGAVGYVSMVCTNVYQGGGPGGYVSMVCTNVYQGRQPGKRNILSN